MGAVGGAEEPPDDLLAQLARWSSTERTARAVSERTRGRALAEQAVAEGTWAGLLVDLAEAGAEVVVTMAGGEKINGRVVGAGRDFAVLERPAGPVIVRLGCVASVIPSRPGRPAAAGDRRPSLDMGFSSVLDGLAGEQAPVTLRTVAEALSGTVTGSGQDVVTLRISGGTRHIAYVPLRSITWLELR